MHFRGILLDEVEAANLQSLVENRVPESRILDYKLDLPGGSDADRREFLADVSSMANTSGGWLLYGIETEQDSNGQDTGIPSGLAGVTGNMDAAVQRLHSMVHDGLEPSLRSQTAIRAVPIPGSGHVMLLGVPRSVIGPHMVTFKGTRRFHRRSDAGKYEPDVSELKQMFLQTGTWRDEVEGFRRQRVRQLAQGRGVPNLEHESALVVHVLPLGRLDGLLDLRPYQGKLTAVAPLFRGGGWSFRYNWDGFQTYNGAPDTCASFTQWFRFGGAEGYASGIRAPQNPVVYGPEIVRTTIDFVQEALKNMVEVLAIDSPYSVAISLFGVGAAKLVISEHGRLAPTPFMKPRYLLPILLLEEQPGNIGQMLSPAFDILWQAAGAPSVGDVLP